MDEVLVKQIHELSDLTIPELYEHIGSLLNFENNIISSSEENKTKGQSLFEQKRDQIKAIICKESVRRMFEKKSDKIDFAIFIAETLTSYMTGIPVVQFSLIIVKVGIYRFCDWEN